jgi:hypothetical protein
MGEMDWGQELGHHVAADPVFSICSGFPLSSEDLISAFFIIATQSLSKGGRGGI